MIEVQIPEKPYAFPEEYVPLAEDDVVEFLDSQDKYKEMYDSGEIDQEQYFIICMKIHEELAKKRGQ